MLILQTTNVYKLSAYWALPTSTPLYVFMGGAATNCLAIEHKNKFQIATNQSP